MSDDIAIKVQGLSKRYRIGQRERYKSARESLMRFFKPSHEAAASTDQEFWALNDVNFEVNRGEVLGIIGRNGAGKSTLLKVLSRITEPTKGRIEINGRVGSLLEVGTGFHPELTGRENVFLNGAILGMREREIRAKFDEIIAFAEIEKFIDTPVKRYSSGMYTRLAFAVAAHLEPEILVVDEVLAVGDAEFQKKCLGKMKDVAVQGRTVLFVSHNMAAVRMLCTVGLFLQKGTITFTGDLDGSVQRYLSAAASANGTWASDQVDSQREASLQTVKVLLPDGKPTSQVPYKSPFLIEAVIQSPLGLPQAQVAMRVSNADGIAVFTTASTDQRGQLHRLRPGISSWRVLIPGSLLAPANYSITFAIVDPRRTMFDLVEDQVTFEIDGTSLAMSALRDDRRGVIAPLLDWAEL